MRSTWPFLVFRASHSSIASLLANIISDYHPRLAFRDDTPRVIEKMQEVETVGNFIWDRK